MAEKRREERVRDLEEQLATYMETLDNVGTLTAAADVAVRVHATRPDRVSGWLFSHSFRVPRPSNAAPGGAAGVRISPRKQRALAPFGVKTVAELADACTELSEKLRSIREKQAAKAGGVAGPEPAEARRHAPVRTSETATDACAPRGTCRRRALLHAATVDAW